MFGTVWFFRNLGAQALTAFGLIGALNGSVLGGVVLGAGLVSVAWTVAGYRHDLRNADVKTLITTRQGGQ